MKLAYRLTVAMVGLVAVTAGLMAVLSYFAIQRVIEPRAMLLLGNDARRMGEVMIDVIGEAKAQAQALAGTAAIPGLLRARLNGGFDPVEGSSLEEWKARIEYTFAGEIRAKPAYQQLRLIGADGLELVRVDRSVPDGAARVVADHELQDKSHEPYVAATLAGAPGEILVSPINLNREQGRIAEPPQPVVRVSTPIAATDGAVAGLLVINLDIARVFARMRGDVPEGRTLAVVDAEDRYILAPDPADDFGFDFGRPAGLAGLFPELASLQDQVTIMPDSSGSKTVLALSKVSLGTDRHVYVAEILPYEVFARFGRSAAASTLGAGALAVLAAILLATLLGRSLARPIEQIADSVDAFRGGEMPPLPVASGEVGRLSLAVGEMGRAIAETSDLLRREVEDHRAATRRAEEHASRAELFRSAVETSDDAIMILDPEGRVLSWNAAATRLYGYRPPEVMGRTVEFLAPPDLRDEMQAVLDRVRGGEKVQTFETLRVTKDGRLVDVAISQSLVRDAEGHVLGISKIARDITATRQEQERFRLAIEASPSGMIMTDSGGVIRLANAKAETMFGYAPGTLPGLPIEVLVPERLRAGHPALRQGYLAAPETRNFGEGRDLFGTRRDGSEFPVELGLNPIQTRDGMMVLAVVVDITARKQQQERFRLAIEASPSGMIMADSNGVIGLANAKAEKMFGYGAGELLGASVDALVPQRVRADHPGLREGYLADPGPRNMGEGRDLFGLRKDGSEFPVEVGLNPIRSGDDVMVLAVVVDITARVQQQERFRLAIEASPSGVLMADTEGRIRLVNARAEKMFGYGAGELLGASVEILVPQRARAGHPELRDGYLADPGPRNMGEGRDLFGVRKDGSEFPVEVGLNPIQTADGPMVLAIVVDITARRAAAAQIEEANDSLRRSNAELEQFAYIAAHDLQEPLRMVASYTELLADRYEGQLDERAQKYIHYAVDGAKRMKRLVTDLLMYSRVNSQGGEFKPVALGRVVDTSRHQLSAAMAEAEAELVAGDLPEVRGDEGQLVQLMTNLVGNAIKFRAPGRPPRVEVRAEPAGTTHWTISVADNGIGIDQQYADKVFQMFQRLHERDKYEGSGIGLSISRKIVERHGGEIWFTSTPGEGTTFQFTLKAA